MSHFGILIVRYRIFARKYSQKCADMHQNLKRLESRFYLNFRGYFAYPSAKDCAAAVSRMVLSYFSTMTPSVVLI